MSTDPRIARTRTRVLEAAWDLLTEVGFEGVTVDLVSERSGVARSTLYRHWRTKEEVLRDAFAARADASEEPTAGIDGQATLVSYARAVAAGLTDVWGRAALSLALTAQDDPAQRAVLQTFVDGNRRDLRLAVDAGRRDGVLDGDPEELVDRFVDLVIAPLFHRYSVVGRPATPEVAEGLARAAWAVVAREGA